MLMNTFYQILTNSEHIPPPILQVKAFQIFLSSIFTSLSPIYRFHAKTKPKSQAQLPCPK